MSNFTDVDKVGQVSGILWFRTKLLNLKALMDKDIRTNWKEYKKVADGMSLSGKWGF